MKILSFRQNKALILSNLLAAACSVSTFSQAPASTPARAAAPEEIAPAPDFPAPAPKPRRAPAAVPAAQAGFGGQAAGGGTFGGGFGGFGGTKNLGNGVLGGEDGDGIGNNFGVANRNSNGRESVPPILVEFANADPVVSQQMEEDLSIMTHLLSQALERGLGEEAPQSKMGVRLLYTGSGRSVRAMYLGGFGALFMIKVNMPLMAAPAPNSDKSSAKATDSEWDKARREVLGLDKKEELLWMGTANSDVPFDSEQVDALKQTLVGALKNASNIHGLKPDEYVSIVVFGHPMAPMAVSFNLNAAPARAAGESGAQAREADEASQSSQDQLVETTPAPTTRSGKSSHKSTGSKSSTARAVAGTSNMLVVNSAAQKGTVLSMRVKKADIDAYSGGKLNLEEFAKKISMATYGGNGFGMTSLNSWVQSGRSGGSMTRQAQP
jgi:hypothetical protein